MGDTCTRACAFCLGPSATPVPCGSRPACWQHKLQRPTGSCLANRTADIGEMIRLDIASGAQHHFTNDNFDQRAAPPQSARTALVDRRLPPRSRSQPSLPALGVANQTTAREPFRRAGQSPKHWLPEQASPPQAGPSPRRTSRAEPEEAAPPDARSPDNFHHQA